MWKVWHIKRYNSHERDIGFATIWLVSLFAAAAAAAAAATFRDSFEEVENGNEHV